MTANVAESGGAQQGIADGMAQDVAIGMAGGSFIKGDPDAADNELAARD